MIGSGVFVAAKVDEVDEVDELRLLDVMLVAPDWSSLIEERDELLELKGFDRRRRMGMLGFI